MYRWNEHKPMDANRSESQGCANRFHVPDNGARVARTNRRRILNLRLVNRSKLLGCKAARLSRMRNEFRKCSVTCGVVIHLQDTGAAETSGLTGRGDYFNLESRKQVEIEAIRAPVHELFGGVADD
jgi:hypothetical protein